MHPTDLDFAGGEPALRALAAARRRRCLDDAELPADPGLRAALHTCIAMARRGWDGRPL